MEVHRPDSRHVHEILVHWYEFYSESDQYSGKNPRFVPRKENDSCPLDRQNRSGL